MSGGLRIAIFMATAAGMAALGLIVWLVPLAWDDETAARKGVVAVLFGIAALGLACEVLRHMKTEAKKQGEAEKVKADREGKTKEVDDVEPGAGKPALSLARVDLRDAVLPGADLSGTVLVDALLEGADLRGANLCGADLSGIDDLERASLEGAVYDDETTWPESVSNPRRLGAVRAKPKKEKKGG